MKKYRSEQEQLENINNWVGKLLSFLFWTFLFVFGMFAICMGMMYTVMSAIYVYTAYASGALHGAFFVGLAWASSTTLTWVAILFLFGVLK